MHDIPGNPQGPIPWQYGGTPGGSQGPVEEVAVPDETTTPSTAIWKSTVVVEVKFRLYWNPCGIPFNFTAGTGITPCNEVVPFELRIRWSMLTGLPAPGAHVRSKCPPRKAPPPELQWTQGGPLITPLEAQKI